MKLINRIFMMMALTVLEVTAVSCSLEEDMSSVSTPDNFFRKYSECQSVVNSCYIPIKSIYNYTYMLATECASDVIWCASGTYDAQLDISPVKPRFGATVWQQCYLGVQRCNFAVTGIERSDAVTEEQRNELLCEAKALRAFYYWTLTCFFGDVPFYLDDVSDNAALQRIALLPRMDANATRDKLIEDLKDIAPKVAQTRTSDNAGARVGASMAWMLIAKFATWNHQWHEAINACKELEKIYGNLADYDLEYNVMFRNKNTPESIFEVQHSYVEGGLSYCSNVASICTPTRKTGNIYDGVEIPELGDQATTWQSARPTVYYCQGLVPKMSTDKRNRLNTAWDYNGQVFASLVNNTRPWMGPKFWCPDMKLTNDSNNYKVFRYADAVLLMAESYCELNDSENAVKYLNMVRNRAGVGDYTFRTFPRLQDEIRKERARELFGEFQRKYDLVRWGIWWEAVNDYNDYSTLLGNAKPCHRYYPIPDTQVVYSKNNLDNKEYAQYGM